MEQKVQPKLTDAEIKQIVRESYGKCAEAEMSMGTSCRPSEAPKSPSFAIEHELYTPDDLSLISETALSLSRGCGNPTGFAALQPGEPVIRSPEEDIFTRPSNYIAA
jgi:hypothetical protein